MVDRRTVLIAGGATLLLTACGGEPGAAEVTLNATGAAGMNPGPDGSDRPLTITIVQLRTPDAFNAADYFALQDPAKTLAADLVSADTLPVAPGAPAAKTVVAAAGTTAIGLIAGYRDPAGKAFRAVIPVAPGDKVTATITLGSSGMSVAT